MKPSKAGFVRAVKEEDLPALLKLYNHYAVHSTCTFDLKALSEAEFRPKLSYKPFLVYEETGRILGYSYASKWRQKPAYDHTVESTVYVDHQEGGKGIGSTLYAALIETLADEKTVKSIIACVTLPNESSVKLHHRFEFEKVGHFKEVGRKFDQWLDVGFWQLNLY
jgi:phosphinothricin acetyltransferase